jgi:hypothetical protein
MNPPGIFAYPSPGQLQQEFAAILFVKSDESGNIFFFIDRYFPISNRSIANMANIDFGLGKKWVAEDFSPSLSYA